MNELQSRDFEELATLPAGERQEVLRWMDALRPAVEGGRQGRGARIAAAAATMRTPLKTTRRRYDAFVRLGWRGLLDRRSIAVRNVAVGGPDDPRAFAEWVKGVAENYGGNLKRAHAAVTGAWRAGRAIPGYNERPAATATGLPQGWSYANIARLAKLTPHERAVAAIGRAAARHRASMVIRTRVGLRPGQIYQFDDVWHDVECAVFGGKTPQTVRPLELCCLDLATAHKVSWGLKPRVRDEETGKRINLRDGDMRFFLAHLLCGIGYSPDGCQLMLEHGTASLSETVAGVVEKWSGGKVRVATGGIQDAPAVLGAWAGLQKGNPKFKAAIESSHRIIHNWARWLPGQTGGNSRETMPEELAGREREFQWLCKALVPAMQSLAKEEVEWMVGQLALPFVPFDAYSRIVRELYDLIGASTDHELEGWKECGFMVSGFRTSFSSDVFPWSALANVAPEEAAAIRAMVRLNPALQVQRKMSRAEAWATARLTRLPAAAFAEIAGPDNAVERRVRNNAIRFEQDGRAYSFPAIAEDAFGRKVLLEDGEKYATVLDPYGWPNPSLFVLDAKGRYVGRLAHQVIASQADMLSLHAAMGEAAHLEAVALAPYRARHEDREGEVAAVRERNAKVLALAESPFRQPSRPTPKADALETLDAIDAGGVAVAEPVAVSTATTTLDDIFGTL